MKKILLICSVLLFGCNNNYRVLDTSVIKGVVSAKEEGHTGIAATLSKVYIQTPKQTVVIQVPFDNENDYKVGDTAIVIIQRVEYEVK
jgi:hypothetical protein